jgi:pyruvate carboxylase
MRTYDILKIAKDTNIALRDCYSIENWGGATFDVALRYIFFFTFLCIYFYINRFLHECPFDRLA